MIKEVKNGVVFYRSTLLKSPHAFSTRHGGVSTEPHLRSMNLGENRGDSIENLTENYRIFLKETGLPPAVVSASQIHSNTVLTVNELPKTKPSLDGFVTDQRGITLCVKIADCLPILLEDTEAKIVSAVHAGWRGSAKGIVLQALKKMKALGAECQRVRAVIGPRIGACCFEVKEDFVCEFLSYLETDGRQFLIHRENKIFCDLPALNRFLLQKGGVLPENIEDSGLCTCCAPDLFFSHRASKGLRGTMAAMIALP